MLTNIHFTYIGYNVSYIVTHTCLAPEGIKKSNSGPRPKKVVHHCYKQLNIARTNQDMGKSEFNSFIHYRYLYSTLSRLLLKSTPNPSIAKKGQFQVRTECIRMDQNGPMDHSTLNKFNFFKA